MTNKIIFLAILLAVFSTSCDKAPLISESMEETFYVRNGGSDMPAFVRGNSASKVFIVYLQGGPGFGALSAEGYPFSKDLEEDYAMVYWDQRHTGNSHGHYDKEELTIETVVKDLLALVKAIKARYGKDNKIFLMGSSWGGLLALSFLVENDYQEEINGWMSVAGVNTDSRLLGQNEWVIGLAKEEIDAGKNVNDWTEILAYFEQIRTRDDLSPVENAERNEFVRQILDELISGYVNEGTIYIGGVGGDFNQDLLSAEYNSTYMPLEFRNEVSALHYGPAQLQKITSPALLIYGKYDYVVPAVQGQNIYEHISSPHKEYLLYQRSGHGPMFTEPEAFVTDVSAFIERHR